MSIDPVARKYIGKLMTVMNLRSLRRESPIRLIAVLVLVWGGLSTTALLAKEHKKHEQYGIEFSSEISAPEADVLQALDQVLNDGTIEGSKEYNKDKYIEKAFPALDSTLFPEWGGPGKVFYKVRTKVLAPVNFKESNDEGTLAVRYIVQSKSADKTIVRIQAVFREDFRRTVHASNGSVETAEFKNLQDRVDTLQLEKKRTQDAQGHRQEILASQALQNSRSQTQTSSLVSEQRPDETLEQHVESLRHQVERVVVTSGGQLKSAPFHSATTLKSLDAGTELVILITTPYWYGVETEDGQHGWVHHSQLEPLP